MWRTPFSLRARSRASAIRALGFQPGFVIAAAALVALAGCSSGGDGTPSASVTATPGAAWEVQLGEAVVSGDAASVGGDTVILIRKVSDVAGRVGAKGAGAAYLITTDPPNTTFLTPVTITLPYSESTLTGLGLTTDDLVVLKADPDTGGTIVIDEDLTADPVAGLVTLTVTSFSTFEPSALIPPTDDVTGKWILAVFKNFASPSGDRDFVSLVLLDVVQDGAALAVEAIEAGGSPVEEEPSQGFVSGSTYHMFNQWIESWDGLSFEVRSVVQFTSEGAPSTTGTVRWYAFEEETGDLASSGGATIDLTRVAEPDFDATGDWTYRLSNGDEGTLVAAQELDDAVGVTRFTLTPDTGDPIPGYVAGAKYFAYAEYWDGDPPTTDIADLILFTLSDADNGTGKVYTSEEDLATEEVTESSLNLVVARVPAGP